MAQKFITPDAALERYFKDEMTGKYLISKSSLLAMCRSGQLECSRLGMKRRYFISVEACENLGEMSRWK